MLPWFVNYSRPLWSQTISKTYLKLKVALSVFGLKQSSYDHSLFIMVKDINFVVVLNYVDDLLIYNNSLSLINETKAFLHTQFNIKDLSVMKYFLGLEIARSPTDLYLHHRKYTLDIFRDYVMLIVWPSAVLMKQNHTLLKNTSTLLSAADMKSYRRLEGMLFYLTLIRPNIWYAVHVLSQFFHSLRVDHLSAAHKFVSYHNLKVKNFSFLLLIIFSCKHFVMPIKEAVISLEPILHVIV